MVIDKNGDAAVVMDFGMVQRMTTGPLGEVKETRDAHPFGKMRCDRRHQAWLLRNAERVVAVVAVLVPYDDAPFVVVVWL